MFALFPEGRMLIVKPSYCLLHNCLPQKSGFIIDSVPRAVNRQRPHLSAVKRQGQSACSTHTLLFQTAVPPHKYYQILITRLK
jgi:hypothetical protein